MQKFLLLANPRTGSEYLSIVLRQHPDIALTGELLNEEHVLPDNVYDYIGDKMSEFDERLVGFKLFPGHVFARKLRFDHIVRHIGADYVIVLWRKSIIEQYCSLMYAKNTGIWFRSPDEDLNNNGPDVRVEIRDEELIEYKNILINDWKAIGNQWPIDLIPIFVCYEDLFNDTMNELNKILTRMSCSVEMYKYTLKYHPMNPPVHPSARIANWDEISDKSKDLEINVEKILRECIVNNLKVESKALAFLPDPEPPAPSNGWVYHVCAPFMPNEAKDNVIQALASGSVSSAGFWPKQLSIKLKQIFEVPVAQPCSNGFTALLLSMQTIGMSAGDEVIMPSMTMIAVPNAVHFVGAVPVFADCAQHDYNPGLKEILDVATDKTRAVVLTHTYGVPTPDLELIVIECRNRGWVLIEDISECVGVKVRTSSGNRLLGTFGQLSGASLYANKILHACDGGFILARDARLGARLKSLVNHGFTPNYHFLHFESAINAKINGLGAALAVGCFDQMAQVLEHRHHLCQWYRKYLVDLPIQLMPECGPDDTPWVFGLQCTSKAVKTQLRAYMAGYGIETRDYFFPLHYQPVFKHLDIKRSYPRAQVLGSTGFYLPTYYDLREEDIVFITDVMKEYFNGKQFENQKLIPPLNKINYSLVLKTGSLGVKVQGYTKSGQLDRVYTRGHPLITALDMSISANSYLFREDWNKCQQFLKSFEHLIQEYIDMNLETDIIENYFRPFTDYFASQSSFEPLAQRPWTSEKLTGPEYDHANNITTSSDKETLQLLVWIIKQYRPRYMLELGSWLGHSSLLMAIAAKTYQDSYKAHIYACDVFVWQKWMNNLINCEDIVKTDDSFLNQFKRNVQPMADFIEPIVMTFNNKNFDFVAQNKLEFVFLDFTQKWEDLELKWNQLEPHLIPNKTIILFNGLAVTSLPFFSRQSHKLKALAKPHTIAKAFLYAPEDYIPAQVFEERDVRKLNFQCLPNWTHHYKNAFNASINKLRNELHDKNANIRFIPAVEETLCDNPELMRDSPWIGIIHMTVDYPELFYTPDLRRLCGQRYAKYMRNCKGLYTLTTIQSEFLAKNLQLDYKIPIQTLIYPYIDPECNDKSCVVDMIESQQTVELILIGGFARDYSLFESAIVPKHFKKVIIINDKNMAEYIRKNYQDQIELRERLSDSEYERQLFRCIPFLSLKYDGAANTLILEAIARNIPILVPNMSSCVEYIGEEYPLLYSTKDTDFTQLLTTESIQSAIDYLKNMDKKRFQIKSFINSINSGIVLQSLPTENTRNLVEKLIDPRHEFTEYDVTLLICSYKRTHHLSKILDSLWNGQSFKGKIQIIVWNNNDSRLDFVRHCCKPYLKKSNSNKSLELIASTKNYFCSVRLSVPSLMASQCLLICDDDCIPGPQFIQFFMTAHQRYPKDVLCLRGHQFFDHKLDSENPNNFWTDYEYLRFKGDDMPEQSIHFVHADTCLVPISALRECASIPMPDPSYALVDDYWISYVLNHKFGRNLRKLSAKQLGSALVQRTDDSDTIGLALYTRPEVFEARIRLYIHHMLQGWPVWEERDEEVVDINDENLRKIKTEFWDKLFVGYNVSSKLNDHDIDFLVNAGINCVRIGAVGLDEGPDYEFSSFLTNPEQQLYDLKKTLSLLKSRDIKVVLTLDLRMSGSDIWQFIAKNLYSDEIIVGYDLINEPFTQNEKDYIEDEVDPEYPQLIQKYIDIIHAIRQVDKMTPIIIEPSYWAYIQTLYKLPIDKLVSIDSNILVSFHFYEPQLMTYRDRNKNRYSFPAEIPVYETAKYSEMITIDEKYIRDKFTEAIKWSKQTGIKLVLGEFGCSRDVKGAELYLKCVLEISAELGISSFIYSFRDIEWDSMDYELGTDLDSGLIRKDLEHNVLMQTLLKGIKACNSQK